jgi:hypothetical protein
MSISRIQLKAQLGLGKVSDITNVRKALGQRDWQNSEVVEADALEVTEYYRLVREQMMPPADALLQIAGKRTGTAAEAQNDDIDETAVDHSEHRDGQEETNGMVLAIRSITQEASLAMTDVADAASEQIVDTFCIALGANVVDKLQNRAAKVRANFGSITQSIRSTPLDLRGGSLPGKKQESKQITGLWG